MSVSWPAPAVKSDRAFIKHLLSGLTALLCPLAALALGILLAVNGLAEKGVLP